MQNPVFTVSYLYEGRRITSHRTENEQFAIDYSVTDGEIKVKLTAKAKITLNKFRIRFEHEFRSGDVFFGNGYQAWTTSRARRPYSMRPVAR